MLRQSDAKHRGFYECFNRYRHRWHWNVDSRTAIASNKEQIQQRVDDYGEGSDFVTVSSVRMPTYRQDRHRTRDPYCRA